MKYKLLLIIFILILSAVIRLYNLGSVPAGFTWDEASLGYNAYSILKTGRDEYGNFLPFTIRSFGDYKPPLYVYLTIPSIALLGLNEFAVRLPSAAAGIFFVYGIYLLALEISRTKWHKSGRFSDIFCLSAALLAAFAPWNIHFSRGAFEANTGLTLLLFGVLFMFKSNSRPSNLTKAAVFFGLSMLSYHSMRIISPLIIFIYYFIFHVKADQRIIIRAGLVLGTFFLIVLWSLFSGGGAERLSATSVFNKQTEYLTRSAAKYKLDMENKNLLGMIVNNRRFEWVKVIAGNYLSHFSVNFLFLKGDYPRHHAPDSGLLPLWQLPFIIIGIIFFFRKNKRLGLFIMLWILISPLASAFTFETPHAIRSLTLLPPLIILGSAGISVFINNIASSRISVYKIIAYSTFGLIIIFSIFRYLSLYFIHMNKEYARYWQYGYREAVYKTITLVNKYDKVIVSDSLEQPYIFFLFYSKYDPRKYLTDGGTITNINSKGAFGIYEFRHISDFSGVEGRKLLYVTKPGERVGYNTVLIKNPDNTSVFEISD